MDGNIHKRNITKERYRNIELNLFKEFLESTTSTLKVMNKKIAAD